MYVGYSGCPAADSRPIADKNTNKIRDVEFSAAFSKRRLYSFDRQYAAERRPREYPAVQKTDDVSRAASGDQCSFAHAFDAPCQQERQQRGNRYERDVESDFEFSEIRIIAPRGVVDESFGAHHDHAGFDLQYDADRLHDTAGQQQYDRRCVVRRQQMLRQGPC